jgi:hypothetical protein
VRDGPGMATLSESVAKVSGRVWISLAAAAVLVAAGVVGVYWAYGPPTEEQTVEEEWNAAITKLGVEPVYPPEEDIEVGDVFAIVTYDAKPQFGLIKSALANRAVRLWRLDLSNEVAANYKDTYVFPRSAAHPPPEQATAGQSSPSIFTLVDHRSDLPIVTFPRFRINASRGAKFGGSASIFGGLGAEASSNAEMEVSITRTQTYGIPVLVAQNALYDFCRKTFAAACKDFAVRTALSTRVGKDIWDCFVVDKSNTDKSATDKSATKAYRMKVEVGLINRVFLTGAIETRLFQGRGISAEASSQQRTAALSSSSASGTAQMTAVPAKPPSEAHAPSDTAFSASDSANESSQFAVLFDGKPLDRPVVFGFESVRYTPPDSDEAKSCR